MSDQPIAETSDNTQQTDIHAPLGFEPTVPASKLPQTTQPLGSKTYIYICRFIILSDKYRLTLSTYTPPLTGWVAEWAALKS
jgi:hypothetical protein